MRHNARQSDNNSSLYIIVISMVEGKPPLGNFRVNVCVWVNVIF